MTNAEWMIKNGYKFKNIGVRQSRGDSCICEIYIGNALIDTYRCTNEITYIEVMLNWLDTEHKESILDDVERRYLAAVIKPFRNDVSAICKVCSAYEDREFIKILRFFGGINCTFLPDFKPGTMFKGMEPDRWYSLEELGL